MLSRVAVFIIFIFCSPFLAAGAFPEAQTALPDMVSAPQPSTIVRPRIENHVSVVRLKVPEKARKLYNNALTDFVKKKLADAKRKVDKALNLCPAFPDALTLRGGLQLVQGNLERAEEDFVAALSADSTYLPGYVGLADVYNEEARFDEALATSEQANALTPNAWNVKYEIARSLIGKKQYDRALVILDEALRIIPSDHSLVRLARAHALVGLKHYPEARTELQEYLADEHYADDESAHDLLNQINVVIGE